MPKKGNKKGVSKSKGKKTTVVSDDEDTKKRDRSKSKGNVKGKEESKG